MYIISTGDDAAPRKKLEKVQNPGVYSSGGSGFNAEPMET